MTTPHGTYAGFQMHLDAGTQPCWPCHRANIERWAAAQQRSTPAAAATPVTAATIEEKFCGCHPYMPNEWNAEGYVCMGCGWNMRYFDPPAVPTPAAAPLELVETTPPAAPSATPRPSRRREEAA